MAEYPYTYARVKVPSGTRTLLVTVNNSEFLPAAELYYKITTTEPAFSRGTSPVANGFTTVSSNNRINVVNNDYVTFSLMGKDTYPAAADVTVISLPDFTTIGSFMLKVASVSNGGIIPLPMEWCEITSYADNSSFGYTWQQVQGITQPITLRINYPSFTPGKLMYGRLDTMPSYEICAQLTDSPLSEELIEILNGGTITVSNEHYLVFSTYATTYTPGVVTRVTVTNVTASNMVINEFPVNILGLP